MTLFETIKKAVTQAYGISEERLLSKRRFKELSEARQMVMYLMCEEYGHRVSDVAALMHLDCSTVSYGVGNMKWLIERDQWSKVRHKQVRGIISRLTEFDLSHGIRLLHGDCMDFMRQFDDNTFDIAVVDPPCGHDVSLTGGTWSKKYGKEVQDWNASPPDKRYFDELMRVSKHQIIWGANNFVLPPSKNFIIWRKKNISQTFSMAMCEYAWTSLQGNAKVFDCVPNGTKSNPRIHPTQKPVALYDWIYSTYLKAGDRILDTHLGSGSSAIAAVKGGFDFTGIEINDQYFEAAKNRIEKYIDNTPPKLDL